MNFYKIKKKYSYKNCIQKSFGIKIHDTVILFCFFKWNHVIFNTVIVL